MFCFDKILQGALHFGLEAEVASGHRGWDGLVYIFGTSAATGWDFLLLFLLFLDLGAILVKRIVELQLLLLLLLIVIVFG